LGIGFGWLTDKIAPLLKIIPCQECQLQEVHTVETCQCLQKAYLADNFLRISVPRAVLLAGAVIFLITLATGTIGPSEWDWEKITLTFLVGIAITIVGSVPDHYLREHIWMHIVKRHLGRVFLWTFFALLVVELGLKYWSLEAFVKAHLFWVLLIAALVGVVPESGPHLIFVMMFAQELIPFSVLLTSSLVQDGHGMLPLLSYTVKDSILIKAFNLGFGLLVGGVLYALGM
ncbi:MAG: selenocysteine protein, partial [candidate division KSB1 bacterium]|nr:selenocysteine protein [candidate division KSB1 bacterium]